ncbi:hypothetical protein XM47_00230 [Catenovulum maritimum]|uniref:Uncharacterized protein n=1 Tax=Catenovulum maritimum TaxID=1513271 RepID=A0A0J8H0T3_9ALTE|nr:hypothetical protein XM47_00230 [Catenovulum maritimum]
MLYNGKAELTDSGWLLELSSRALYFNYRFRWLGKQQGIKIGLNSPLCSLNLERKLVADVTNDFINQYVFYGLKQKAQ